MRLGAAVFALLTPVACEESVETTVAGPRDQAGFAAQPYVTSRLRAPIATHEWWSSLVWHYRSPFSENLYPHPLSARAVSEGLEVGYPDSPALGDTWYAYGHAPDLVLGVTGLAARETRVDAYSDWTVTALWDDGNRSLRATFGHGLPFVYAEAGGGDARVWLARAPEIWAERGGTIGLSVGDHHYGVFAPPGASWRNDGAELTSDLGGRAVFSLAILPERSEEVLEIFAARAFAFVTDSRVSFRYDSAAGAIETRFDVATSPRAGNGGETVLALYPHQWLHTDAATSPLLYRSARGPMRVLLGSGFRMRTPLPPLLPHLPEAGGAGRARLARLVASLAGEGLSLPEGTDVYAAAKFVQRLAAVVPIADQIGALAERDRLLDAIEAELEKWLMGAGGRELYYEPTWGTLIARPASHGSEAELNDHHFQYGYFVSAAAAVARHRPGWAAEFRDRIEMLIRDAASFDRGDPLFPFLRHFDPYAGHSWASGHGAFDAGNNQESSSESLNFAAAVALWGAETGDHALRDGGLYLYATESLAAKHYWFDAEGVVFPQGFGHPVVGILWGNGGSYSTWWTSNPEEVHGINWLPIGAASLRLGSIPDAIRSGFQHMVRVNGGPPTEWRDILLSTLALADPEESLRLLREVPDYAPEAGSSPAQTHHWVEALAALGRIDSAISADSPTAAVFRNGKTSYVAYNPRPEPAEVSYSDGFRLRVPPRSTAVAERGR